MAYAGEVFSQLLTVQAYAQEEGEQRRYSKLLGEADSKQQLVTIFHKAWTASFHLLTNSAMVLAACYAGTLASRGQLDPSSLVSFTQLSWRIGEAIGQLLFLTGEANNTVDAVGRLQAIIEREPRISPDRGATIARDSPFLRGEMQISNHATARAMLHPPFTMLPHPLPGEMQLKDVSFAYAARPDSPALQGCSLTLKPGQVTALVGPSGGGKTTVTNLLARFYEPDAGTVTLDGADLRTLKARWLTLTPTPNPDPNQAH